MQHHEVDIERYRFTADSVTTSPFRKCSEVLEIKILKFSNRNNYSEVLSKVMGNTFLCIYNLN